MPQKLIYIYIYIYIYVQTRERSISAYIFRNVNDAFLRKINKDLKSVSSSKKVYVLRISQRKFTRHPLKTTKHY